MISWGVGGTDCREPAFLCFVSCECIVGREKGPVYWKETMASVVALIQ